jgi:hypothetical protein
MHGISDPLSLTVQWFPEHEHALTKETTPDTEKTV